MLKKKNKTIILGKSGTGKSYLTLQMILKNEGTSIIANGAVDKKYYEKDFPALKDWELKEQCFPVNRNGKYYFTVQRKSDAEFLDALIAGCDYGMLKNDKAATVLFDDDAWVIGENDAVSLWKLSHVKCSIIITATELSDVLRIRNCDITEEMIQDIMRYWKIMKL